MPPSACGGSQGPSALVHNFSHSGNSHPGEISTVLSDLGMTLQEPYGLCHIDPHPPYFQQLNNGESISWLHSGVMVLSKVQLHIFLWVQYPRHLPQMQAEFNQIALHLLRSWSQHGSPPKRNRDVSPKISS